MIPLDAAVLLVFIITSPILAALVLVLWAVQKMGKRRGDIPLDKNSWVENRWVLRSAAGYLAVYAACLAYGALIEAHWIEVTRTDLKVDRPVLGYDRFRIVHLSDLHLEGIGRREQRMVEAVREARPHLILLTGDYMNVRGAGPALIEVLRSLGPSAVHGVYGVGGNWDTKFVTRDLFKAAGAVYLEDDTRLLEREGRKLRLVGHAIYPNRSLRELLGGLKDDAATIYLQHKPDAVDELRDRDPEQRVDLFLCGHTHGGQVCLPFWGAVITLSKFHKKYERGLYRVDGVPMYVNRGVGVEGGAVPRVRFLARPEVAVLDLVYR